MTMVKFYKTIFRFNDLIVDHLDKLISPLSIGFIRIELRHWCIDNFASGLLFTESLKPQKRFEINWSNVAITSQMFPLDRRARGCCVRVILVIR